MMTDSTTPAKRRPGRPRDPRIDEAVLRATRELLDDLGYQRLTYDAVAQRAGVHRPAVYRRWPTKLHLVLDACKDAVEAGLAFPESGSFEENLRFMVASTVNLFAIGYVRAGLAGALAEIAVDQDMIDEFAKSYANAPARRFAEIVDDHVARGVIRPVDGRVLLTTITGTVFMRLTSLGGASGTTEFVDQFTELLMGACRP
jgi:AcrR family transcriptional regulator